MPDALAVACFRIRFRLSDVTKEWELTGLRRAWAILEALPAAHVGGNDRFDRLVVSSQAETASGVYIDKDVHKGGLLGARDLSDRIEFTYNAQNHEETVGAPFVGTQDPLSGKSAFDVTLRHEIGHAVDEAHHFSAAHCSTSAGGAWKSHEAAGELLDELTDQFGLAELLSPEQLQALRHWFNPRHMNGLGSIVEHLPFWGTVGEPAHKALSTLQRAVAQGDGQTELQEDVEAFGHGKRVFVHPYGKWASYDYSARARRVSNFQFKARIEWFAEAYAAYYSPDPAGKGALLGRSDPATKEYFDKVVDPTTTTR